MAEVGIDIAEVKDLLEIDHLRCNGRFDLVLRTRRRGVPVHVIEFKGGSRSPHFFSDIRRLSYVSSAVNDDSRLKTNYLVFTTNKSQDILLKLLEAQQSEDRIDNPRGRSRLTFGIQGYQKIPHWSKGDSKRKPKFMAVAVIEVKSKR